MIYAQSGSNSGTISDADTYEPLPGANMMIKGTSRGTAIEIYGGLSWMIFLPKARLRRTFY